MQDEKLYYAECAVLGTILVDNEYAYQTEELRASDFVDARNRAIFSAIQKLVAKNTPVDLVTLEGLVAPDVSMDYLAQVMDSFAITANFAAHKAVLLNNSVKRRLQTLAARLSIAATETENAQDLLTKAEDAILALRRDATVDHTPLSEALDALWLEIEERMRNPHASRKGIPWGIAGIDRMTHGLQRGKLYYLGARPGMGKTSFLLQVCTSVAKRGLPVVLFSLEMTRAEVLERMISQNAGVPNDFLQRGAKAKMELGQWQVVPFSDGEMARIAASIAEYSGIPLDIIDTSALTPAQIRGATMKIARKRGGVALVAIDYLGYLGGRAESQRVLFENNSKALKALARDMGVPVLCAAQLSRQLDNRPDKRPVLADFKESGGIEADADVAAFLYRESDTSDTCEFLIRKNRSGKTGSVLLRWNGDCTRFE